MAGAGAGAARGGAGRGRAGRLEFTSLSSDESIECYFARTRVHGDDDATDVNG